jgi:hypothetical protein
MGYLTSKDCKNRETDRMRNVRNNKEVGGGEIHRRRQRKFI